MSVAKRCTSGLGVLLTLVLMWIFVPLDAQATGDTADVTGVSYGPNPEQYEIFPYTTELDQATTRTDYMAATRALRGDMWDQNVPYNGSTLREVAAEEGITTREQYVNGFVWDESIERIALQRAVETRAHGRIAHERTVDADIYSATYGAQQANSEIIAWGYPSMYSAVYNGWGHGELADLIAANGYFNHDNGHLHILINPSLKYHGAAAVDNVDLGMASRNLVVEPNEAGTGLYGTFSLSYAVERSSFVPLAPGWTQDFIGNWYYLNPGGYKAVGELNLDGNNFLLEEPYGMMVTGWYTQGNDVRYYDSSGVMVTGWKYIDNTWYFFDDAGMMATGLTDINGVKYYFRDSGAMATGWQYLDNSWYYFYSSGAMATGWIKLGSTWYYLESSGVMVTGFNVINGVNYYFRDSGAMATGWIYSGEQWYYANTSGALATGWIKLGSTWYYLDPLDAHMLTGFHVINGVTYYFADSGAMATGWRYVNSNWYYFASSGAMYRGWLWLGGTWYYLSADGTMLTGSHTIDGTRYVFNSSGALQ
ncbi:MAG: N-acetylmuramoyl-L-alanine amidase family protein [Actinomycetaceae bacterium]|nr:N-acetylmuramoyl-L-alanine amidase family protein [Actinomycetaceae bacterium]